MSLEPLEVRIGHELRRRGLTLALAESCTGGLVAHRVTNVPGSSTYFRGGLVAYAPDVKEKLVGVAHATLAAYDVVSAAVAGELARGARRVLGADIGLGITGLAGPEGGTAEKPVGLVYLGLSAADADHVEQHHWQRDRIGNKEAAAEAALVLLDAYLRGRLAAR